MKKTFLLARKKRLGGFSLIEIAIVLVIISVLIAIVAVPLATQVDRQRVNETDKQLEQIKEAIYGFAMANGRLPCPSRLADNGQEAPSVAGSCPTFNGFLPAVTLGIAPIDANGFAVDAWGGNQNRIRYAVGDVNIAAVVPAVCPDLVNHPLTQPHPNGIKVATMGCLISKSLLQVCSAPPAGVPGGGAPCPAGTLLTLNAPFVLVATGKNASAAAIGLDEQHNLDADMFFVSHIASATAGNEFAHQVTWGSLPILNAKLVAVGKLP